MTKEPFVSALSTFVTSNWQYFTVGFVLFGMVKFLVHTLLDGYYDRREEAIEKAGKADEECEELWKKLLESDGKSFDQSFNDTSDSDADDDDDLFTPALPNELEHVSFDFVRKTTEEMINRSDEFYKLMNGRRTIRFFSDEPVPKQIIYNIIKTAGTSPSGAHTEPWTFVIIEDKDMKEKIREIVEAEEKVNYDKRMGKEWTTDLKPLKTTWQKEYLTNAPFLVAVFKQTYGFKEAGKKKKHYYHEMSVSLACGIMLAAIQYCGLVTLTSTPLNAGPALRKLLDRPVNEKLTLLLPIGYPSKDCTVPNLTRKNIQDIIVEF